MLETALMYKDVFFHHKQRESQYKSLPSKFDWYFAKVICDRLKLFHEITELFSRRKYPTANLYFPNICEIRLELLEWLNCPISVISEMAVDMLSKFDKYWGVINGVIGVAAVLDPQYKMTLIEFYLPRVYSGEYENQLEKIQRLCYDLVEFYASNKKNNVDSSSSEQASVIPLPCSSSLAAEFDSYVLQMKKSKVSHSRTELDHYLDEDVLPRRDDFDIITWCKVQGVKYPILQSIAKDILVIPVSIVASESTFSASGRLVSPHRNRLQPKTLEALMCAQNWLWAAEIQAEETLDSDNFATIYDDTKVEDEDCLLND